MELTKIDKPGTGNSQVRLPKSLMIELNNTPVDPKKGVEFVDFVHKKFGLKNVCKVHFSNRKTVRTWGSACKTKMNIYRWSVWVLIHELGHVITPDEKKNGRRTPHGETFGFNVTRIYDYWREFCED